MPIEPSRRTAFKLAAAGLATAAFPAIVRAQSLGNWIPNEERLDAIKAAMTEFAVPGVGIAVLEDGEVAWEGSFGLANIDTGAPIKSNTLFQAASLTKPVFAYVVMRMVEEGAIGFDDRLADYFRPHDLADNEWNRMITVRHVLTHKTGFPNWRPDSPEDEGLLLEGKFEPGTAFSYSGEAFCWLQQVCETITGLGLNALVSRYLFEPAGLTDMAMTWLPERDDREVYGHIVDDEGKAQLADFQVARRRGRLMEQVAQKWQRPIEDWRVVDQLAANAVMDRSGDERYADQPLWRLNRPGVWAISSPASLRTTPRDYARFIALSLGGASPGLLAEETRQAMLTIQTPAAPGEGGPNRPVGIGWSLEPREGGVAFDHWGFNQRRHISSGLGDTSNRRGLVMMTNGARGNAFMDKIGPVITGIPYRSYV